MPDSSFYINKFPIYASRFVSADQVLLAGGGGPSKSGYKNRIATYSIAQSIASNINPKERTGHCTGDVLLADDEDAPGSLAMCDDLILSGVNESSAMRKRSGDNHHLRSFRLRFSTEAKGEQTSIKPALEHQIFPDLDVKLDDYQKITKVSPDGKLLALVSAEGKAAIVSIANMTKLTNRTLDSIDKTFVDVEFATKAAWIATTTKVYLLQLPISKDTEEVEVFNLTTLPILKTHKISHIRCLSDTKILLAMNDARTGAAYLTYFEMHKGQLLQRQVIHVASRITGLYLSPAKPSPIPTTSEGSKGAQTRLLAITTSDSNLVVYRSDTLARLRTWKHLHAFPISTVSFSPDCTTLLTASIDEKVNVLDLRALSQGAPVSALTSFLWLLGFMLVYLLYTLYSTGALAGLASGPGRVIGDGRGGVGQGHTTHEPLVTLQDVTDETHRRQDEHQNSGPSFEERMFQEL